MDVNKIRATETQRENNTQQQLSIKIISHSTPVSWALERNMKVCHSPIINPRVIPDEDSKLQSWEK